MEFTEEHIAQLLSFVEDVYKRVPDFAKGVRKIVNGESSTEVKSQKLDKIEKYLSLDYGIDDVVNPDYSFIADAQIRDTLNSDYREMLRFRYGTREHSVNFGEFARYANLQMEMLVNYYYAKTYGDDPEAILNALQANDPDIDFLSLYAKINGLKWEFNWNYYDIKDMLNIIKVRNEESHRSPGTLAVEIANKEKAFNELKAKKNLSLSESEKKDDLKKKIGSLKSFKKWLDPLPFDEVNSAIKKLSERIKDQLTY